MSWRKKVGYKSRSSVNKIESDGRGLPQNKIVLFANALQTTPAYLMGWENENEMHQAELSLQDQQAYAIDTLYSAFGDREVEHFEKYIELIPSYARKVDSYTEKLLSMQKMEDEVELAAAHERTDIEVTEESCVLAEEIGHYYTSSGDITRLDNEIAQKQEHQARLYGYNLKIGLIGIIKAYQHGCRNLFEMADFLDVTEEYLSRALDCYKRKYGCCATFDNYAIYFEPCLEILDMRP